MNTKKILSTMAIAFALALSSCSESEDINTVNSTNDQNFKVVSVQGRLDVSQARGSNAAVCFRKHKVAPDANGNFVINDTVYRSNISARQLASDNISDTVRIVIGNDTLREIPVNSWSNILPTNYIVQRNVSAVVNDSFAQSKLEAVWWSKDSIAHVLELGKATTATKYSGFIYSVYDDSMFAAKAPLYSLLVRIRSATSASVDSIKAASNIVVVTAITGDLAFDANQFVSFNRRFIVGSALTPRDSSVSVWSSTKTLVMKLDTLIVEDTLAMDSAHTGSNWRFYENHFDSTGNRIGCDSMVLNSNVTMSLKAQTAKTKGMSQYVIAMPYTTLDSSNTSINTDTISTEIIHFGLVYALDSNGVRKEFKVATSKVNVGVSSRSEPLEDIKVYLITRTIKLFYTVIKD